MEQNKRDLIEYRISRALETVSEAYLAFENNKFHLAENRIYYAQFYLVSALAIIHDFSTGKHATLKGWFNKEFIANGKIDKEFYKIFNRSFEKRQAGDYDDFVEYSKEEVAEDLAKMDLFVNHLKEFVLAEQ